MQALILVGGEGTRLRPLTSNLPKPVVPLAGQPFMSYMLQWLRSHGVDDIVLSCGFLADGVRRVLGDGSQLGIRLRYVEERRPLGTGGALKYAEALLGDRFFMLNGDVLTDIDLTAQLAAHERHGARATLALIAVEDPSAYGLVRLREDGSVGEFLEKPGPEQIIDTNLINAGVYIIERDVLDGMAPAGTNTSIERDVFPTLVDHGLYGYQTDGYWLDIGTPDRYLQATFDIIEGNVHTDVGTRMLESGLRMVASSEVLGRVLAPAIVGSGCEIAAHATVGGRTVLGNGVRIGEGAHVESSVLLDGVQIGARTTVHRSIVAAGSAIGEHCSLDGGVVVGAGVRLGADNVLRAGARIFPGVQLPDGAIKF
ncbi:MAG: sugar phosphate nucleotidyltransferase [Solirubrobacteraceae bacterium]